MRGYLQLLRPANVATAAADVLAGYAIVGLGNPRALGWLLVATVCLYGGGVVLNDVFDRNLDRIERPERPIPSGRVPAANAAWLGALLLAVGLLAATRANLAAGAIALAIVGSVLSYDGWAKRHPLFGPINMGLCRALNLTLGMAAVPAALAVRWPLAFIPLAYIAAVTMVSRGEVHGGKRGIAAVALMALFGVVLALLIIATLAPIRPSLVAMGLAAILAWRVLPAFLAVWRDPEASRIRHAVRTGVLALVLVNASMGTAYAGASFGLIILAVGLVSVGLARLFPVT